MTASGGESELMLKREINQLTFMINAEVKLT